MACPIMRKCVKLVSFYLNGLWEVTNLWW
jgi:hypothetical protein